MPPPAASPPTTGDASSDQLGGEPQVPSRVWDRRAVIAYLVFWALWTTVLSVVWLRHPDVDHGDWYSDANTLNAGRTWDRHGFGSQSAVPQPFCFSDDPPAREPYITYPPLPDWIHQGLKACGLRELWHFRAVALAVTALAGLLALPVFAALSGSWCVGALAGFFYQVNAAFSGYADNLRYTSYAQLSLLVLLLAWCWLERATAGPQRRRRTAVLAIALFIDTWLTIEHVIFIWIFAALRTWRWPLRPRLTLAAVLVAIPLFSGVLRVTQTATALGGFDPVLTTLTDTVADRQGFGQPDITYGRLAWTWAERLGLAFFEGAYFEYEFEFPLLRPSVAIPVLLLGVLAWRRRRDEWAWLTPAWRATGALLLPAAVWFILLRQHGIIHRHLVMLLLPGLSLLLAVLAAGGLRCWPRGPGGLRRWLPAAAAIVLLLGFTAGMRRTHFLNQELPLDASVRRLIDERRAVVTSVKNIRESLPNTTRLWFYYPQPDQAYLLDRYFETVHNVCLDDVQPGEAWVSYAWTYGDGEPALRAFERFGFPDMRSVVPERLLIFHDDTAPAVEIDTHFGDELTLRRLRCVPTLDGQAHVLQYEFAGPFDADRTPARTLVCRLVGPDGDERWSASEHLPWLHDDERCFGWHIVPSAAVQNAILHVGVYQEPNETWLLPQLGDAGRWTGAGVDETGRFLSWPVTAAD
ncbi:MAG: hypothetical protein PVJ57_08425 [Phycisphaerae bacterium]|jgi:hypothetical protein